MPTANSVLLDSIAPLKTEIAVFQERFTTLQDQIENLNKQFERVDIVSITERLAVLEDRVGELKRLKEESEKKRSQWLFWGIGVLVTLAGTLAVQLLLN